ncbi:circularly permuted type 2 ATP-grasp protein [Herbaspirillum sp. RTI4]|uniref:circularly permuted type 2 ATP-grasp protein n=1 Tax=Herbaspirillum sp. RTI4 TaxID=3048640 RepID=UPI002AB5282A|nr:circularly permuted type 2 ATP-grasp protein [Herbaspirillum sp. RTI4]MDY7576832.1 circularly permuted type 2 ATP-grasp protein [Herbaspirillum sp. RTI4]MEA9981428.1 circularly permuted type 2 ATP-grasp protein [Herbaspirillum sp. RTI4]
MYRRLHKTYSAEANRYDEMLGADGVLRPHWRPLIEQMEGLPPDVLTRRAQQVRDAIAAEGVTYNVYADPQGAARAWELDLLPQLIAADEWQTLATGVAQRASLLNATLADLYGPQHLLSEGLLPPALVFGQHDYVWPCHHIVPPGGVHLHVYAVDLARSPDGRWWVVADRTQVPSGAGYALQNRQIMTRAMPDALREMRVQSLRQHFQTLRESLIRFSPQGSDAPLIVLLTPGPYNETYSEHAFLAHTLGFQLVEGADLMVRDDMVFLKTLSGLRRVHAILRRLDDDYCDPLELRSESALGVPGLVQAARLGNVLIANALGSGILESTAMHGFLPAISQRLQGRPLALPSVASWWCGERPALEYTLAHLDELVILPTFPSMRRQPVYAHTLNASERAALIDSLQAQPHAWVAQEWVRLSQGPVLARGDSARLISRPLSLRMFAVARPDGSYEVMAGGLARVAPYLRDVVSMQQGGVSKDVWVLKPLATADAIPATDPWLAAVDADEFGVAAEHRQFAVQALRSTVDVSSHAGESLFWMGRYAERCDNLARVLRATLYRSADDAELAEVVGKTHAEEASPFDSIALLCETLGIDLEEADSRTAIVECLIAAIHDPKAEISVAGHIRQLHRCAYQVREHLSLDNWLLIHSMPPMLGPPPAPAPMDASAPDAALGALQKVLHACAALAGHALDDMTRDEGWHFLMLGRHIERMGQLAKLMHGFLALPSAAQDDALGWLLDATSSVVTYRVRYRRLPEWLPVLHLLVFDASNPHGLAFQFHMLVRYLEHIDARMDVLSIGMPRQLTLLLEAFDLAQFARESASADDARERLLQLMEDAMLVAATLSEDLTRHFFTPLSAPVTQGIG